MASSMSQGCVNPSVQCGDRMILIADHQWDAKALRDWQLLKASSSGDLQAIREALEEGAAVDTTRGMNLSPTQKPAKRDRASGVHTPRVARGRHEWSPRRGDHFEVVEYGLHQRSDRVRDLTPLMRAAKEGHERAVSVLLEAGASVTLRDEDGMQPLHFAAQAACSSCCALLLTWGASSAATDDFGRDAFSCLPRESTAFPTERKRWELLLRGRSAILPNKISGSDSGKIIDDNKELDILLGGQGYSCYGASMPRAYVPSQRGDIVALRNISRSTFEFEF